MRLETERLLVRTFVANDVQDVHHVLDRAFGDGSRVDDPDALAERASWVEWNILNDRWHAKLQQPPYGEKAIVVKETGTLIGAVGYVPCLDVFAQIPELRTDSRTDVARASTEMGLFWGVDPDYQGQGYATEAARAMIDHAFTSYNLGRIIATTEYDNLASQAVMRRLGMAVERNPLPTPPWLQIVGVLERPER